MYESNLATTRRSREHSRDKMLIQFAIAAWVSLLALGLVLLL